MLTTSTSGSPFNSLFPSDPTSRSRINNSSRNPLGNASSTTDSSTDAFASQLAQALQSYLSGSGSSATDTPLNIQITPSSSQNLGGNSGSRQFVVTISNGTDSGGAAPTAPVVPSAASSPTDQAAAATTSTPSGETATPPAPIKNEADAYWATQPPAIQVLRTIRDEGERTAKAKELSNQGYAIDVPIMVWNLDPLSIMSVRQSGGMTWIPAMGQTAPETGPGINFPGMKPYDPLNPLPGSIPVSTAFAKGLENTSPWSIGDDVARL